MLVSLQGVRNSRGPRRPNTVAGDRQHGPETLSRKTKTCTIRKKTRMLEADKKTQ